MPYFFPQQMKCLIRKTHLGYLSKPNLSSCLTSKLNPVVDKIILSDDPAFQQNKLSWPTYAALSKPDFKETNLTNVIIQIQIDFYKAFHNVAKWIYRKYTNNIDRKLHVRKNSIIETGYCKIHRIYGIEHGP